MDGQTNGWMDKQMDDRRMGLGLEVTSMFHMDLGAKFLGLGAS